MTLDVRTSFASAPIVALELGVHNRRPSAPAAPPAAGDRALVDGWRVDRCAVVAGQSRKLETYGRVPEAETVSAHSRCRTLSVRFSALPAESGQSVFHPIAAISVGGWSPVAAYDPYRSFEAVAGALKSSRKIDCASRAEVAFEGDRPNR